jgi:predicted phage terminase large subunit-like protein
MHNGGIVVRERNPGKALREWRPVSKKQEAFHSCSAFELLFGGKVGGGKSECILVEALRYVNVPGYSAIIFRRTFPELEAPGGIIARSRELLSGWATYQVQKHRWTFPSGATLTFSHLDRPEAVFKHHSAQYAYQGWDELTTFEEYQYLYLFSRARTVCGVPVRIRSGTNPGGRGEEWVLNRWGAWLGEDANAKSGEIRHFKRTDDMDTEVKEGTKGSLSRCFIEGGLRDNPILMADEGYIARLEALPLVERKRLLDGEWGIRVAGNVFHRDWFRLILPFAPEDLHWVRYWDLAQISEQEAKREKKDPSWTASAAVAFGSNGTIYIKDMVRGRWDWPQQREVIKAVMLAEPSTIHGIEAKMHGKTAVQEFLTDQELAHVPIQAINVENDKLSRALAWSYRAEAGKVVLINGHWIPGCLNELVAFDGTGRTKDDQVDTISGGVGMLSGALGVLFA